jgi:hypothetical protein
MGLLQSLQLAKQAVVCGIRDDRRIQHVIEMPMVHELAAQFGHARWHSI